MNSSFSFNRESTISTRQSRNDDEIDFLQLVKPIWFRKWSVLSLALVVMMLTILIVLNMTPIFRSTATLLIEQRSATVSSLEEIYGLEKAGDEYLLTQFELLKSRELAQRVVDQLALTEHPEFDPRQREKSLIGEMYDAFRDFDIRSILPFTTPEDLEQTGLSSEDVRDDVVDAVMARTSISPLRNTQLVKIDIEMADPKTAAAAANALAQAYIETQLEARLDMSKTATTWMNKQLDELKENLSAAELQLQAFRERENLVDLEGVTTLTADELSGTGTRLLDARREKGQLESQYRQVQSVPLSDWRALASVPAVLSDPLIQEFRGEEAKARSRVEELTRRYGPKYPKMIAAQTELEAATANLKSQVEEVVRSIERKYQLAVANEGALQASFNDNRGEIQDITRKEFTLRELEREVDTNRQLYDTFLTRLKETAASQDFEAVNARVTEKAVVPDDPAKPKKALIVGVAGILALFVGMLLAWLHEFLNNTFKNTADVENNLNLPVLGIVPLLQNDAGESLVDVFEKDGDRGFSEAIRTVRTSAVFSSLDKKNSQVILVTSSVPGEGKTTMAANLARSLSSMHKTLIIEADLRKPNLRKHFGLPVGTPGVANVLGGTANIDDCINPVSNEFDLMVAGTVPPNPQELLSAHGFPEFVELLRSRYKYVVIDSPPTLAVSDAIILSAMADSLIYVVKSMSTSISMAKQGVGSLLQKNAPVSGVVLNQVDMKKADKYGYSYSGYYDYYGYGSSEAT